MIKTSTHNGKILIPQLSEYSAIYLCNLLRRYDAQVVMGHSGDIYQSSISDENSTGNISSLEKSRRHLYKGEIQKDCEIIISQISEIPAREILSYLGFVHGTKVIFGKTSDKMLSEKIDAAESDLINEIKGQVPLN